MLYDVCTYWLLLLSSRFERTEVFWMICSWWCHVVTCFDLTILESSISIVIYYWDALWLLVGEPLDIVSYHWCLQMPIWIYCDHGDYYLMLISCSWRIDVIIVAYYLWCFAVACIGLRWLNYLFWWCHIVTWI